MTKRRVFISSAALVLLLLWTGGSWAGSRRWYMVACGRLGSAAIDVDDPASDQTRSVTYELHFCHYHYTLSAHRWRVSCLLDGQYDFSLPGEMERYESDRKLAATDGFDRFVMPRLGAANCSDQRESFIEAGGGVIRTHEGNLSNWVLTLGVGGVLMSIAAGAAVCRIGRIRPIDPQHAKENGPGHGPGPRRELD